jgi:hypothetical protein
MTVLDVVGQLGSAAAAIIGAVLLVVGLVAIGDSRRFARDQTAESAKVIDALRSVAVEIHSVADTLGDSLRRFARANVLLHRMASIQRAQVVVHRLWQCAEIQDAAALRQRLSDEIHELRGVLPALEVENAAKNFAASWRLAGKGTNARGLPAGIGDAHQELAEQMQKSREELDALLSG